MAGRVTLSKPEKARVPRWAFAGSCKTAGCEPTGAPEYEQGTVLPDPDPLPEPPLAEWREVRMPELFRGMDIDHRGYPVPYTLHPGRMPADKRVDFRVLNSSRHERAARLRLCSVCGKELPRRITFLGGPMCVQNRIFGDGPLHEECASYARRVCPFLSLAPKSYSFRPLQGERSSSGFTTTDPNVLLTKPERLCVYVCRQYRTISEGSGKMVYIVEPALHVDWFTVDGNFLCRTRPTRYSQ